MSTRSDKRARGFNLVEVLVAMAMLSSVLLAVITLFFMGRKNVYSGKQMTRATSVTVHASEDLGAINARTVFEAFSVPTNATTQANPVAGVTYNGSILRSTDDTSKDNTAAGYDYLARWKALLPASRISGGRVTLVIIPLDRADPDDVTSARLVRLRIITQWTEARRARSVFVDTVKFNRRLGV